MIIAAPVYPEQVALVSIYFPDSLTRIPTETMPGAGYVTVLGHEADHSTGPVTLADDTFATWCANEFPCLNPTLTAEDESWLHARFPAQATAATWLGFFIEVGYQGVATPVNNIESVLLGDWSNLLSSGLFTAPLSFDFASSYLPDAPEWSTFRTAEVTNFHGAHEASLLAGTFAVRFQMGVGFAYPEPARYPYRIAWVRIIPILSQRPPLRQRQRSDGLAASGAPRHHQHSTLQTSNRQRAVR